MRVAVAGYPLLSRRQWRLCGEFTDRGIETHLLVPGQWPTIDKTDHPTEDTSFTTHYHRPFLNGRKGGYLLSGVRKTLDMIDPDVVITHAEPWQLVTTQMQLACERRAIPHAVFSWENLVRVPQLIAQRGLERLLNSRIDGAVAGSDATAERLEKRGYDGPLIVAPQTGVDTEAFSPGEPNPELLSEFNIPTNSIRVGYVGRFAPEKGLNTLLDAMPEIIDQNPEVHLFLVGDGKQSEYLLNRMYNDTLLNKHISIVSEFQPYERMPDIIRLSDVVVYPSETVQDWAEQFGYTVAEAMACKIPVVTTDCGSLPYVVGDTGRVGPQTNAKVLAENIIELLSDEKLRDQLGDAARDRVLSEFSLSAVAEAHLSLLADIAD